MRTSLKILIAIHCLFQITYQSCVHPVKKVNIICFAVSDINHEIIGPLLTCKGASDIASNFPEMSLSNILYENKTRVENLHMIESVYIDFGEIAFIPSGMEKKFKSLKALMIANSGLLSVKKENLKGHGNSLQCISFAGNLLKSIDADIFEYNQNLKLIDLTSNPIKRIELNFFENLKTLKGVELIRLLAVACMNQFFASAYGHKIVTFIWNNEKCFEETARIEARNAVVGY